MKTFKEFDPTIKSHRGKLKLLRAHPWNLPPHKTQVLQKYLEKFPAIKALFLAKQELMRIILAKKSSAKQWKKLIRNFLKWKEQLKSCPFPYLQTLGKTLKSWQEEITRMW